MGVYTVGGVLSSEADTSYSCPICGSRHTTVERVCNHMRPAHRIPYTDAWEMVTGAAYVQTQPTSAIYQIWNPRSGRFYIGRTRDVVRRFRDHKQQLRCHEHPNVLLQFDYELLRVDGLDYEFAVIEECAPCDIPAREKYHVENSGALVDGYNVAKVDHHGRWRCKEIEDEVFAAAISLGALWSGVGEPLYLACHSARYDLWHKRLPEDRLPSLHEARTDEEGRLTEAIADQLGIEARALLDAWDSQEYTWWKWRAGPYPWPQGWESRR